ncbi:YAP-binding/ALF4/Glomulin [Pyronema domesticum]|uniref:Similar to UPF0649 protein C1442.02 acc. no. Q76PC4 n=1 Tax=Pyronema omphalodes (strain CBS 100304) TaxID=1076935 RepID=U4L8Z8_PYROM|nr:YAP-binding/ALF4/Glomulin [Pyronema domesticum]CCX13533.1 Similar to UPF0649 protein C1442.02; acc. no. Q76PC4 [Pyronema omphalodes CBS 100304]
MSNEAVTLEKAIASITQAADELKPEEFIDYSVILDVHINWSLEEFTPEDQYEFLEALKGVLESHDELTESIAWDLVVVLLPYLESTLPKTAEIAESLIDLAARTGNPREVYIKVLQGLTSLSWSPSSPYDEDEDDEDEAEYSGDEDEIPKKHTENKDPAIFARHSLRKFNNLLKALSTVHPRISAKFPSKFLSTELSTILTSFTKATQSLDCDGVTEIVERLVAFLKVVRPELEQARRPSSFARPPLPPRTSTGASIAQAPEEEDPEDRLQSRLMVSFLSHILSGYLLRTQKPQLASKIQHEGHVHPIIRSMEEVEGRGLEVGWAGKYDEMVLRPNKSKVPGGKTLIDQERDHRAANTSIKAAVDEISFICGRLGVTTEELMTVCQAGPDLDHDSDDDGAEIPAPKAAEDIPLSKEGALLLLANRLSVGISEIPDFQIYPEHSSIAENFMIYGPGQTQPAIIDAILFLGALALHSNGLGDTPDSAEKFFIYLQIFSVISTNSSSAQCRFLANSHVARCLRAHPNEAIRLAYVRDTLEHCPFESVKAAVIGVLKDEIIHATTPVQKPELSVPSTPNSIFGTSLCMTEIFDSLFPDLEKVFENDQAAWEKFKEIHPRFAATVNFYLLLLMNKGLGLKMGVDKAFREKVEKRFLEPVKKRVELFRVAEQKEGSSGNVAVVEMTLERVKEAAGDEE